MVRPDITLNRHGVVSMSSVAKIINRNESFDDDDVPNKWEWLSKTVTVGDVKERVGEHFRKQSSVKAMSP